MRDAARGREEPQEPLCSFIAGSVPVTPAEGWCEQDVQHLLKYPFFCKIEAKNASLFQTDLPCPPTVGIPFCWMPAGSSRGPSTVRLN